MKGPMLGLADPTEKKRWRVNMAYAPTVWQAEAWQLVRHRNPNWLNSIWLGTVVNVLNLPTRVLQEVLLMALRSNLLLAAFFAVFVPVSALWHLLIGLAGRLSAVSAPPQVIASLRATTPEEADADEKLGTAAFIKPAF